MDDWTNNLESKFDTFVAHVDFARGFDSVSLPKLIHKLKWAGVRGLLLSCIQSLLTDRLQKVKIGNSFSDLKPIVSGVPQGSVLGPILFIFYINDITNVMDNSIIPKLYADDLKAYNTEVTDPDGTTFNKTLCNITKWADTWQLPISTEKSKWLLISNKRILSSVADNFFELAGATLPRSTDVVDLGVNFNSKLNFKDHISTIIAKAKQRLF